MRRGTKIALLGGGLVVAAGVGGVAWYVFDDDAPPPVALPEAVDNPESTATTVVVDGVDGAWVVQATASTFVGYRVDEVLAGINRTAVGRSPAVTGSVTASGTTIEEATFIADLTQLSSDESRRDNRIRSLGLQTDSFPEAAFRLTEPIELAAAPAVGEAFAARAVGDLTLHGVTQSVTLDLEAQLQADGTVVVIGSLPVLFADYDIDKPDVAGFVTTEDNGVLELSLVLSRG